MLWTRAELQSGGPSHLIQNTIGLKCLRIKSMKHTAICFSALVAAAILAMPVSSEAAGRELRAKFSFEGLANCDNPPIRNFPIHGEGTGVLSTDRTATLDMDSTVEGKVQYHAKLGGAPIEAPAGSASLHVVGRSTLRAVRDYPNNQIIITMTISGSGCSMKIDQRLKPGKRQYTFFNGSGISYCARPIITHSECAGY
jgi:hypothetical protein